MSNPKSHISKQVFFLHLALLCLSLIYFLNQGFLDEQFIILFSILAPITSLYGGIAFKTPTPKGNNDDGLASSNINMFIYIHFALIMILISLSALFPNVLRFSRLIIVLGIVESTYGIYLGAMLQDFFKSK